MQPNRNTDIHGEQREQVAEHHKFILVQVALIDHPHRKAEQHQPQGEQAGRGKLRPFHPDEQADTDKYQPTGENDQHRQAKSEAGNLHVQRDQPVFADDLVFDGFAGPGLLKQFIGAVHVVKCFAVDAVNQVAFLHTGAVGGTVFKHIEYVRRRWQLPEEAVGKSGLLHEINMILVFGQPVHPHPQGRVAGNPH